MDNMELWYRANAKQKSVSGQPPLSFKANGEALVDWRINGRTSKNLGGVGERTDNLFYGEIVNGSFSSTEGTLTAAGNRVRMDGNNFIYLQPGTYTINANGVDDVVYYAYADDDITTFIKSDSYVLWLGLPCTFTVNTARYFLFGFRFSDNTAVSVSDISNIMLNSGSKALPYEPYGYKTPVTCGEETTNIYIGDEQLGDGDSISYADTGVKIPTIKGTNTLSIGTAVQPSSVAVKTPGAIPEGMRKYLQYKYDIRRESS